MFREGRECPLSVENKWLNGGGSGWLRQNAEVRFSGYFALVIMQNPLMLLLIPLMLMTKGE
uniref:Uncharacterized protein n=1 Tax=mine drainage metagenome TaxID=410659 RepID=E6Q082_9ZZZZ